MSTSITDDGIIMAKRENRLEGPAPLSRNHSQSKSNIEDLSQPLEIRVKSDSGGFLCVFFKKGAASYGKTLSVQELSAQMGISLPKAHELVKKYTDVQELNAEIIREFVDKIYIYKAERIGGKKVQHIKIFWNCIG